MIDVITLVVAWLVIGALFTIPSVLGVVFLLSLLGHLTQFLPKR